MADGKITAILNFYSVLMSFMNSFMPFVSKPSNPKKLSSGRTLPRGMIFQKTFAKILPS
jgi:hypothetical protein